MEALRQTRLTMLLDLLHAEVDTNQYATVVKLLTEQVERGTARERHRDAGPGAGAPRGGGGRAGNRNLGRKAILESALSRSAQGDVIAALQQELMQRPPARRRELMRLLGVLGDQGRNALVNLARRTYEVDSQAAVRELAECDAPGYAHLRRLLAELPVGELETSLRTLFQVGHPLLPSQIAGLVSHTNPEVRKAVLRTVMETESRPGAGMAVRLLDDPLPEIRRAAAQLVGRMRAPEALPALCHLLESESGFRSGAAVKEAAACALGQIGAPDAIPALAAFLFRRGLWVRLASSRPRKAAVEALRRIGTPEVRQVCPVASVRPARGARPVPAGVERMSSSVPGWQEGRHVGWRPPSADFPRAAACLGLVTELAARDEEHQLLRSRPSRGARGAGRAAGRTQRLPLRAAGTLGEVRQRLFRGARRSLHGPPAALGNLLGACLRREVEALVFRQGVTREELEQLAVALATDPEALAQEGGMNRVLEAAPRCGISPWAGS